MVDRIEVLIEKLEDWIDHTDDFTEQTVLSEVLDDLKDIIRGR